ncbi:hypothetical protein M0805_005027, partial [Coniferiporia weirii]
MPKGQKSSASSATRKKHARKAAGGPEQLLPLPKEKKKDKTKGKDKTPRVKVFVLPSKPAPVRPDPLDSMGIAKQLPPDILIVLRRLGKKDSVTKRKALEDLQTDWVDRVLRAHEDAASIEATLLTSLPVWLHHAPSLLLSSSRRIRLLAAGLHASLLRIAPIHEQVVYFLREAGDPSQVEAILGSWCMATKDVDRQVSMQAAKAWDLVFQSSLASSSAIDLDESALSLLLDFIKRALFDPAAVYTDLNPVQPAYVPSLPAHASPRNKNATKRPSPLSPTVKSAEDEGQGHMRKPEDDEESEGDRKGRIRVGALGVLRWTLERQNVTMSELLSELLSSPLLWTSLYHGPSPPFCSIYPSSGPLGDGQPVVRKAAWGLLLSILKHRKEEVERGLLPTLSAAILRSAWVEPDASVRASMWEPLLTFLTQYPKAWEIERAEEIRDLASKGDERGDAEDSDDNEYAESDASGERDNSAIEPHTDGHPPVLVNSSQSKAYREFLQFLELGCHGSPVQGYPTVVIIVFTIPNSILGTNLDVLEFLTSFWAALDGRALSSLERTKSSAAFLSSLLECLILLTKRLRASIGGVNDDEGDGRDAETKSVVGQQVSRVWEELVSGHLRVESEIAGKTLARTFSGLSGMDEAVFSSAWDPVASTVLSVCRDQQIAPSRFSLQLTLLRSLTAVVQSDSLPGRSFSALISAVMEVLSEECELHLKTRSEETVGVPRRLTDALGVFGTAVFADPALAVRIDKLIQGNLSTLLLVDPTLIVAYVSLCGDADICSSLWSVTLKTVASEQGLQSQALSEFLDSAEKGLLPPYLKPKEDEMDSLAVRLVADVLGGREEGLAQLTTVRRLLEKPGPFISRHAASGLLHGILYAFSEKSRVLLRGSVDSESILALHAPLVLISSTIKARPEVALSEDVQTFLPDVFGFGFLLPRSGIFAAEAESLYVQAKLIWRTALSAGSGAGKRNELFASTRTMLRDLLSNVDSQISPDVVLQVIAEEYLGTLADLLKDFFPSSKDLDYMLDDLPTNPIDPILAIVDPLVPPPSTWKEEENVNPSYDRAGLSEYARVVSALLTIAADNRYLVRSDVWLLRHFLTLSLAAVDRMMLRSVESAFFSQTVSESVLRDIDAKVKTLMSFLLANVGEEGWHAAVTQSFLKGSIRAETGFLDENITNFVMMVLSAASKGDTIRESRVLYTVMRHILNSATSADAEQWMTLARRVEKQFPNTALAIVLAVTESAIEPPSLDRYRNELAAGILGVRASKANTDGLALLRRLAITAPDPESDVVFLPQNRAVNFMKVCQTWITSDIDIDEDAESEMTLIFQHLAPILQNVPGAHWELIFDVIENNLEGCSFADSSSLPILARTLRLVLTVQDLARMNKTLRTDWNERELSILTLVRDLVQKASIHASASSPRSVCWEMAFSIVQNLPSSLIDHESLPNMAHLLLDPSPEVAKMAYTLLRGAAKKRTEYLVVEAGVDTSTETTKYELPDELLQVLQLALELKDNQTEPNTLGYLLGWMIVFDLFNDASLRVKMGYAAQLRDLDLIESNFLPNILDLLDIYSGRSKPFNLEMWSIEEYFVTLYDSDSLLSAKLLAAHLFYRALLNVPFLISTWWGACKDKQLSSAVASLTTKHYSPVLIASELRHVKDPIGAEELSGENWSIKVATGTGEVTASYTVDEEEMEIAVRLPQDYPLHGIEVRDVRKLGVDDKRWRGWLLAVQQIVTSQNGRIVDGLSMFKKNVTHHFENQTECAICYSIISVSELSLPKKRCKTCKNRFHAGCLYKWFNTSHTSSCP